MQQRVLAILVAHSGADYLERTLAALEAQTRAPDAVIAVDAGSADRSGELLATSRADQVVAVPPGTTFGSAVSRAVEVAAPAETDNEWLWLLAHDNAPEPRALERLLGAVEIAPSVSVAGPKLMRWEQPDVISEFGESMTRFGSSVSLVEGELDQAQHDVQNDVLGVAAGGMLVRRSVWALLGGFDPGLPSTDAALDFSVRARLASHRVILVPGARVSSAGGPQHFDRRTISEARRARLARAAQLHRRLVYSPAAAFPLHWLSLVPLAVIRSIALLIGKRPASVGAEFAAALSTAFGVGAVVRARGAFRRNRRLGWAAIDPLRLSFRRAQEQRAHRGEGGPNDGAAAVYREEPVGFISGGGLWAVAACTVLGIIAFGGLIGSTSVAGGGLMPLNDQLGALWAQVGWGWRDIGVGFTGAADPFAYILAILGSITFWQPSQSIVLVYLAALPIASLGAWFCARRLTRRPWLPAVAALLWGLAPPFLSSLSGGHLGASIAHILLPWLVLLALAGVRSWSAVAAASLIFAAVAASAPVLAPALLVGWGALLLLHPRQAHRIVGIPLPAAALFAPLVIDQAARGSLVGLLADPGLPYGGGTWSEIQLALGSPADGSNGWAALLDRLRLPAEAGTGVVAVLLLALGALALLAFFVRGSGRAFPALGVALLGYSTAVISSRIDVSSMGADPIGIWPGSALSLFWLGLIGAAVVALDAIGRAAAGSAALLAVSSVILSVPLISAGLLGVSIVQPGPPRLVPAVVDAEANTRPRIGTLVLRPVGADAITATLERGRGTTLDDQSTLAATATVLSTEDARLATLAGNLTSRSGYDSAADLTALGIGFVVLMQSPGDATAGVFTRAQEALDGNALFAPVGQTANGLLWRYTSGDTASAPEVARNTDSAYGRGVLIGQGIVVGLATLITIPTGRPRKRVVARGTTSREPATTFDKDTDD